MLAFRAAITALAFTAMWLPGGMRAVAGTPDTPPAVGVAMPNEAQARWVADGAAISKSLKARGYDSDVRNADDDVMKQISQIKDMIRRGEKVLIIAPVDSSALGDVLTQAAALNVKVIAYDRLIRGTSGVDYYATFDNFQVGVLQAQSLLRGLGAPPSTGPFSLELFGGSPDDENAHLFYDGAMSILGPLIKSRELVVRSGQVALETISTPRWDPNIAHARLDNLLGAFYIDRHLDAVLSANDELSRGILASLERVAIDRGTSPTTIVTGQDCEIAAVKDIIAGKQYSSVFKDTRKLADLSAQIVVALLTNTPVPTSNSPKSYNGVKQVPSYQLMPSVVEKTNVDKLLIRSGYYSRSQIY